MERRNGDLSYKILNGRYKIIRKVGVGGMATVYGAYDLKEQRTVAIKVLSGDNDGVRNGTDSRESAERRFVTEAATMSGFFDSSYYAKVFKRYIGYTPKEYLEKIR